MLNLDFLYRFNPNAYLRISLKGFVYHLYISLSHALKCKATLNFLPLTLLYVPYGSHRHRPLAKESITLTSTSGEAILLKDIVLGCGHKNVGTFNENELSKLALEEGLSHLFLNWVLYLEAENSPAVWFHFILILELKVLAMAV